MNNPQISFVIPLYNEEENFQKLTERIDSVMNNSSLKLEVVLINDGSQDNTPILMAQKALNDKRYNCVFLSRNHGHQLALTAGLVKARGSEGVFILDGDLQDPPELLEPFYSKLKEDYDVVYAVRKKRKEGLIKKILYLSYYRILKSISYINLPLDSGDFSMVSRRVIDVMNTMPEESRYLRGMRSWIGFKQIGIEYERSERHAGESKYSFKQLFSLAFNGIFNFSEFPISFIMYLGASTTLLALCYLVYTLIMLVVGEVPRGFTTLLFVIILFSGVQLLSLGLIGQYVLRIFFQVKKRPLFVISKQIVDGKKQED
jgi:dolichol-phosphate mannosyltransferase